MAEGGYRMSDFDRPARDANIADADVDETSFIDPAKAPLEMSPTYQRIIRGLERELQSSKEDKLPQRRQKCFKLRSMLSSKLSPQKAAYFRQIKTPHRTMPLSWKELPVRCT